jgi:hypothetical protein
MRKMMTKTLILVGCFLPLAIVFIVMKLAVWVSAVNTENSYVGKEHLRKRGPFLDNPYADVDEEEEEFTDRTDYR